MTFLAVVLISFAVIAAVCGLGSTLIWIQIIGQLRAEGKTSLPEWGRKSFRETRELLRLHKEAHPRSILRKLHYATLLLMIGSFLFTATAMLSAASLNGTRSSVDPTTNSRR
jgi:hypothetical protein